MKIKMQMSTLLFCFCMIMFNFWMYFSMMMKTNVMEVELFSINSMLFSLTLIFDKISVSFSFIVSFISSMVFMFSIKYMEEDEYFNRFIWILLLFVISMNLLIFSGSLFFLLLGWDGLGITSFALIIYYQSNDSLQAGFHTLMINRLGDALIVSVFFMFTMMGSYNYLFVSSSLFLFLSMASLTKSAQYPFSSWLPAAMAAPTPVSALVHSSTLVTAGIFLIIRMSSMEIFNTNFLMLIGSLTCLLGGWGAVYENDLKKIIALSTLSQLGVMVFCLGLGLPELSLFHLFSHAMFKALLFLAAGSLLMCSFGNQDIRMMGGLGSISPISVVVFNISSLCLIGAPFLSSFYSKHLILEKMFETNCNLLSMFFMFLGTLMTAKYVIRTMKIITWSKMNLILVNNQDSLLIFLPMVMLMLISIFLGKFYSMIEIYNYTMIQNKFSLMINLLAIIGVFLGLNSFNKKKNNYTLSSMFYLVPLYMYSTKLLYPLLKSMKTLDYGWMEVSYLLNFSPKLNFNIMKFFNWPKHKNSFYRTFWFVMILLIIVSFNI